VDVGEGLDNDTFAVRRARLNFTMDIHENIQAFIEIDPAAEWAYRVSPTFNNGLYKRLPGTNSVYAEDGTVGQGLDLADSLGGLSQLDNAATGGGLANELLIDAYIKFHGLIPHHEFTIGQFRPHFGWEGMQDPAALDFVERAMCTTQNADRDLGVQVHGFWWGDDVTNSRFHYWFGGVNGAGNFFGSSGSPSNRGDDNDAKDFFVTVMLQPLVDELWGTIELGYSARFGTHGESGDKTVDGSDPVSGLMRKRTAAIKQAGWASYHPGGPVKGLWFRGEYTYIKDRNAPFSVLDVGGNASWATAFNAGSAVFQGAPNPINTEGWFVSMGYNLGKSIWADDMNGDVLKFVKPLEFVFRYQAFGNIMLADQSHADGRTDIFQTEVLTAGFNYYIKGNNAKIQFNYNWVDEPDNNANSTIRGIREVNNDSAVVNFQVAF
jgi:hypothetical protein